MLQACGYATDPQYAQKLRNIIAAHNLKRYDTEAEVQKQMIGELKKQIEQLTAEQAQLRQRLETLESRARVDVPAWAREAVDAAVKAGIVDTPEGGSLDFYRMLTVMHRTGHIGNN
jgi:Muramidase (flagellum-specific)